MPDSTPSRSAREAPEPEIVTAAKRGALQLREEAESVAYCMNCDQRAAWHSDERKAKYYAAADAVDALVDSLYRAAADARDGGEDYPLITLAECDAFERHAVHGAKADPTGEGVEYALIQPYDLIRFCRTVRGALVTRSASSGTPNDGVALIAAERARQIAAEGWSLEHDDTHAHGEMAITAACYAANDTDAEVLVHGDDAFPWGSCHDKRKQHDRIRQLTIAGALIAAEIDRLQRLAARAAHGDGEGR